MALFECISKQLYIFVGDWFRAPLIVVLGEKLNAVAFALVSGFNGLDNFLIFHTTLEDSVPDAFTATFNAEFYNAAIGVCQVAGSFFIEKAHMGIDHKGEGTDLFISGAKLLHIFAIKSKKVIV